MTMRLTTGLLALLLSGCQGSFFANGPAIEASPSVMRWWGHYQVCRTASDPIELRQLVEQFERPMPVGSEPPAWLVRLGDHVSKQPLRLAVNPQALGVACTLRAAQVLAETDHATEAAVLYRRILVRYPDRDWDYYVEEARTGLDRLLASSPAVLARSMTASSSR